MSFFLPVYRPARCAPAARVVRNDFAPLLSLFDDTLNELARPSRRQVRRQFAPRFNVSEGAEFYSLEGELPGVDQKDISIEFTDENTLKIQGRVQKHTEAGPSTQSKTAEESAQEPESDASTTTADNASTKSHQATVEDEKEWTEVDTPATSEAGPSTAAPAAGKASEQVSAAPAQAEQQPPQSKAWLSERYAGEFSRSFSFATRVNQEAVTASLQNGLLSIIVPKAAKPENRKIAIE